MLSLGDLHIRRGEIAGITGRGRRLRLVLDWPQVDLPVLIDLPARSELRFAHLEDEHVGIPVQLDRWNVLSHSDCDRLTVLLCLSLPPDDEGPPNAP